MNQVVPETQAEEGGQGFAEFVALIGAMMGTQALAIDAMLPALPTIGLAFGLREPNRAQLIVTTYLVGIGIGQLLWGVLSDRFGRRPVLLCGLGIYTLASLACSVTASFHLLLVWRVIHGLAAASAVVARSVIRDRYAGRRMARVMSLTFIVFITVPIVAPAIGQGILRVAPWRYLFAAFSLFGSAVLLWTYARLPETLHREYRLPLQLRNIRAAVWLVVRERASLGYTLASTILLGSIFAYVGMVQQIFADVFHRAALMPAMFALCASGMGVAAFCNSRVVERFGMRVISHTGLLLFVCVNLTHAVVAVLDGGNLWIFVFLQAASLASLSIVLPNFAAMALGPLGSVAGVGASLQGFSTTFGGALIGAAIGQTYRGATLPLPVGTSLCGLSALCVVLATEHWRLFRVQPGIVEVPLSREVRLGDV